MVSSANTRRGNILFEVKSDATLCSFHAPLPPNPNRNSNIDSLIPTKAHGPEIMNSIGNNDVQPDYDLVPEANSTALRLLADSWVGELTPGEYAEMVAGGFYARDVVPGRLTVLSLNTIIYSAKHVPDSTGLADPFGQFAWLEQQLTNASDTGRAVYVMGHIPPVLESYRMGRRQWHAGYVHRYLTLMRQFALTIRAQFFGHFHSDEFRVEPGCGAPPIFITSAITPMYLNAPSFRVVICDPDTFDLVDYEQVVQHENGTWFELYRGSQLFSNLTCDGLTSALGESDFWRQFSDTHRYPVHEDKALALVQWRCLLGTITEDQFATCVDAAITTAAPNLTPRSDLASDHRATTGLVIGGVVGLAVLITVLVVLVVHRQRFCSFVCRSGTVFHTVGYNTLLELHDDSSEDEGDSDLIV